jgi:succinate-semialdehyde dehydrogenase / glutarate-semialdehyde dehydrogenase
MRLSTEEIFGPVVAVSTFATEDEALDRANQGGAGLAAYLFTREPARIERMLAGLRYGHVGVNTAAGPTPEAPFGGMRESGIGREGGLEGVLEYVELQTSTWG